MRKPFFSLLVSITSLVFTMVLSSSAAFAQTSGNIDRVRVIDLGGNKYKMVVKGTFTVQNKHFPVGISHFFLDPNDKTLVAKLKFPFDFPQAGKTTTIEFVSETDAKGNGYIALLKLEYTDEKNQKITVISTKTFNVP